MMVTASSKRNYNIPQHGHGTQNTEQYNCHLFYATRGLPGAFLGLSWGFLGGFEGATSQIPQETLNRGSLYSLDATKTSKIEDRR